MSEQFIIDQTARVGKVTLNVSDLQKMTRFYEDVIGLTVLSQTVDESLLGIKEDRQVLIQLLQSNSVKGVKKTGLFHTAFLLPSRKDLGNVLMALLRKEVPIQGASDHGYSEAIYLDDPENNGIEIYRDKPVEEWDIKEDGRIIGVTEEMDADGVLASRDEQEVTTMPSGTQIGHVHMSVSNLEETRIFYMDVLGLDLKCRFGSQALFFAAGNYHHHIGANTWAGLGLPKRSAEDLGLVSYSIIVSSIDELERVKTNMQKMKAEWTLVSDHMMTVTDPNGILVSLEVLD